MSLPVRWLFALATALWPLFAVAGDPVGTRSERSALVIVDAQTGVLAGVWDSPRVIRNLQALVANARKQGAPVFWVQHQSKDLPFGSEAWKLDRHFSPAPGEPVIHKRYNSSFADTDLEQRLKAHGVTRVVLAGAATNWCIRSTAYSALDRGFDLTLVSDAHSTEALEGPDGTVVPASQIVADLNTVMRWVEVPRVRTEVLPTAQVAFPWRR